MGYNIQNMGIGIIVGIVIGAIIGATIGTVGLPMIGGIGIIYGIIIGVLGGVAGGLMGAVREFGWPMQPLYRSIVGAVSGAIGWVGGLTIIGKIIFGL
ncbi:MAG: hypothetical protein HS126_36895 [Anaerolineales bacterium]|nr:hypothetical protein [Anaerolineales bacterium]